MACGSSAGDAPRTVGTSLAGRGRRVRSSVSKKYFGLFQLARLLEGPAQEQASLFAFVVRAGFLQHGLDGFFDVCGLEGDLGQGYYDLPNLTVYKVRLAGVDPPVAGQYPGPALHADGVLDVLVLEAEHLDPQPVGGYQLWLYAYRRRHEHSLTVAVRSAVRELALT